MTIEFKCDCGELLKAKKEWVGRKAKCPKCGRVTTIPGGQVAPPPEAGSLDDLLAEELSPKLSAPEGRPPLPRVPDGKRAGSRDGWWDRFLERPGSGSIVFKWIEPTSYRVRLRGDLLLRAGVVLAVWAAGTGLMLPVMAHNTSRPGVLAAFIMGLAFFGVPGWVMLFYRRKHASGPVKVRKDDIYCVRMYATLAFWEGWTEMATWPYEAISSCEIVPHDVLDKSFSVMLLAVDSESEIIGIPKKVDLRELREYIESKGVPVEFGRSIPAQFTKGLNPTVATATGVFCAVSFLAGLAYYCNQAGIERIEGGEQADAPDARREGLEEVGIQRGKRADARNARRDDLEKVREEMEENSLRGFFDRPVDRPDPIVPQQPPPASSRQSSDTELVGGLGGFSFRATGLEGQPVVGFKYSLGSWDGQKAVEKLEPLFDRDPPEGSPETVLAREGYAVGAIHADVGEFVHAVRIVFMRVTSNGRLDPTDSYTSDWIGPDSGEPHLTLGGTGAKVIGILGRQGAVLDAVGLVLDEL